MKTRSARIRWAIFSAVTCISFGQSDVRAADLPQAGCIWQASDTLSVDSDASTDAADCLAGLRWKPTDFMITAETAGDSEGELRIRFPSPHPSGDAANDSVCLEWYPSRDLNGRPQRAPAVVIVHESGRSMAVGRAFARGLNAMGMHTFLLHMPGYGARRSPATERPDFLLTGMRQAIADVRRSRDAVAALPLIDASQIALQGTSLGGFVTATVAGLDRGFQKIFVLLAGGHIDRVVLEGARDAAKIRLRLEQAGVSETQIRDLARRIEPLRLAHRIDSQNTWLFSAKHDTVVPPACSAAFAVAAGLPESHHIVLTANHYSGVLFMPAIFAQIRTLMAAKTP